MAKNFQNVQEFAKDIFDKKEDQKFLRELDEHLADTRLVSLLTALRCREGKTQKQLADLAKLSQSAVSKMENKTDGDLHFGSILAVVEALGYGLEIGLFKRRNRADEIRYHVQQIHNLASEIHGLAGSDKVIIEAAVSCMVENIESMMQKIIEPMVNKLRKMEKPKLLNISIAEEETEEPKSATKVAMT